MLTLSMLQRHWPHAPDVLVAGIVETAPEVFKRTEINTDLRMCHFMAQISHECGAGTEMEESLWYKHPQRLMAVWPFRFPTYRSALAYVGQPKALADYVYNHRMGNRAGSDDGWNFRGRGCLQITGRDGYERIGRLCGIDLIAHPSLAADPKYTLLVAATEFQSSGCLPWADKDNIMAVSALINVGRIVANPDTINGFDQRVAWLKVWKHELMQDEPEGLTI
jgi:putative chitinase